MKAFLKTLAISLSSLTLFCSFSIAQSSGNSAKIERVTELSRTIERGSSKTRVAAKERFGLMRSLAESDPEAVLSAAFPDDVLSRVPDASRKYFEVREKIEGELEVIAECEEHKGRIEYFVKQGSTRRQLYVAGEPDSSFVSGKKVSVDALKVYDVLVASSDSIKSADTTSATQSALTGTTGEKRVLVILVNFQDKQTQPFSVEQARDVTFNQTSNFIRENSYGQTWLTGDVYGWYTIPVSSTVCDTNSIATYAQQAAANAGANLASYSNFVYAFPANSGCTFTGLASVGGAPAQLFINEWYELAVVGHEFGHNLGLFHSRAIDCGGSVVGNGCTSYEYGDIYDVMGGGDSPHYNLYQKERLGWINGGGTPPLQTVSASGVYSIDAYVPAGSRSKGLKVLKSVDPSTGSRTWYYIERRTAIGFDSYFGNNASLLSGVVIHIGSETSFRDNYLLDMTPATSSWFDAALGVGQSFTDPDTGTSFTVLSADSTGASISVNTGTQACVRANPTVSVTPGQSSWISPGTAFSYMVSVTNNNSGGCQSESFNLSASFPTSLSAAFSASSVSLTNGASASAMVTVSSSPSTADGTYNFGVSAANVSSGSYSGVASASTTVVSRLGVTAVSAASKYSRSQTVTVTATVTAAGDPVGDVGVTFTMTKAGGAKVTQTAFSGPDGRAVFTYKFNRKSDPVGTYTVSVAAATKSYSGQASTSFSVTK